MSLTKSPMLICSSFMSDKIMPMTEAVEGYELFDKAKVHRRSHQAVKAKLNFFSHLRSSEIIKWFKE